MTLLRTWGVLAVVAVLAVGLAGQVSLADRAYNTGFQTGYKLGQSDARDGLEANYANTSAYRRATDGYNEEMGSLETYRTNFKAGFEDGYKDGYAKALTPEQMEKQRQGMAKACSNSDVVITTAQLFGHKAPVIITNDMIAQMKPGSVIVDMAVESGGNVEGSQLDEEVVVNGVRIIGLGNLPGHVAMHASQMYSSNLANLIESYWDTDQKTFKLNPEDDIIKGCLITHGGQIVHEMIKNLK